MSKIGMNLMTWTSTLDENAFQYFRRAKEFGYNGVELAAGGLMEKDPKWIARVRSEVEKLGLECTALGGIGADTDTLSEDESVRQKGKAYMKKFVDTAAALGAKNINGVWHAPFRALNNHARTKCECGRFINANN